ncbi:hypothetical protein I6A60_17335 [Frankia sp. AgB1.9]|uniref:hypothetical protein n=1 Tax=unclassified Frankia TaxID=2632575 RepID=UPI001933E221|nr:MULTISPECIES: hypothetical protein [unclassified Frankia]MBL7489140.1 hypothetical protein [Frankia sp. AgW1.1]MBL7549625.1 hypothetical protein [Frankia sp. AgB1.9]MBL7618477.1 hypothetical protein [Frankia sp. AgB1.8]
MVTIRRRGFGALWMVALLVVGLWGADASRAGSGMGVSDRALAVVSTVPGPGARADVVFPRVDGRSAVSAKLAQDHPGASAVAAELLALLLPGYVWWRRRVGRGGRPDQRTGVPGARGPPASLARAAAC